MYWNSRLILFTLLIFAGLNLHAENNRLQAPSGLRTDLVKSPGPLVLIGSARPLLSWEVRSATKNVLQTACQLVVAEDRDFVGSWNSGRINTQSGSVLYSGPALRPNRTYYWKVRVWDNRGRLSDYSPPAVFSTAPVLGSYQTPVCPLQVDEVKPVKLQQIDGVYRVDFGKDAFARLKLNLKGANDNDTAVIRLGEAIRYDGSIDRHPGGTVRYSRYVLKLLKGDHDYVVEIKSNKSNTQRSSIKMPAEIGEVTPFRYAEIEGKVNSVAQLAVHYPFNDGAATFHSSDTTLNAVWELCKYSMKATSFTGYFIDGDRERTPYEADAYINQLSDYAVNDDYTLARRSGEYLISHPTWPTEWILQSVLIAWNDYLYTGDIRSLMEYYPDLKAKSLMALEDSTGLISTQNGKMTDAVIASVHFNDKLKDIVDWPQKSESDGFVFRPYNAVVNAFYYRNLVLLKQIARCLGKKEDASLFDRKAKAVRSAYRKAFYDRQQNLFVDGVGTKHTSLHANFFAMAFGLSEPEDEAAVLSFIHSRGMACSVYGAQFLLDAVYDAGDSGYGLGLLVSKQDRSWCQMIRSGSTMTTEAWDIKYKPNQDWNHAWGAAPSNIISRKLMGIEPITPGWKIIRINPQIANLSYTHITIPTVKGGIEATYSQSNTKFEAKLLIPANTIAYFTPPVKQRGKYKLWKDGREVNDRSFPQRVGSGAHIFVIKYLHS